MKTTITLGALLLAVLVGGYAAYSYTRTTPPVTQTAAPIVETTATTTSTPATPTTSSGYTMQQVAQHNTAGDCWTSISGTVYDLTKWIGSHPGGEAAIIQLCGTDGTSAFTGQHGRDGRAKQMLLGFSIGPLAN